jgi:hypothetical protein
MTKSDKDRVKVMVFHCQAVSRHLQLFYFILFYFILFHFISFYLILFYFFSFLIQYSLSVDYKNAQ